MLRTLLATMALTCPVTAAAAETPVGPNIVIFLSDDMGWGQPGFNGGRDVPTPHLDRLAREGVRLTQFYVQAVCSPTRAALLTGRYPLHNGMEQRTHGNDRAGMLADERTLAQALRDAGYFTAIIGKWHLGIWYKHHLPLARGFDHQYGHYGALVDYFTHMRDSSYDWHRNEQPILEEGYTTFLIADEFARVMDQRDRTRPFFCYVPFNAVHSPIDAPPEYRDKYPVRQHAVLECMDIAIGRMLATLETQGVLDDTLVIFFNDNGGTPNAGNLPYRGHKGSTYEGGVRVPCVARWPRQIASGSSVDAMLHVVDLYPTLVTLAGGSLDQPLPLDGLDAWGTIARGQPSPRSEILLSASGYDGSETGPAAIRAGDFKLTGDELFNLRDDPYEQHDLAAQLPDKVEQLRARLRELSATRRPPETHQQISSPPPMLYGEEENRSPLPDWIVERSQQAREQPPARPRANRRPRQPN